MTSAAGVYIVTLNNDVRISVNAHDSRIAANAIAVNRANVKVGKARNLAIRRANYIRTFGADNVNFYPIALVEDIATVEQQVLARLCKHCLRGRTRRRNEWLTGITAAEVEAAVVATLREGGFQFQLIGSVPVRSTRLDAQDERRSLGSHPD